MHLTEKKQRLLNFAHLCTLGAFALGYLFLIAKQMVANKLLFFSTNGTAYINDFVHFYQAGLMTISEQAKLVYDPAVQLAWSNRITNPVQVSQVFYIQYVPFIFPLMVPLALFPIVPAYLFWSFVSLSIGIAGIAILLRNLRQWNSKNTALMILGILASMPSYMALLLGQLSWILLGIYCIYYWCWQRKKDLLAGVALALTSVKPQYALFFALPLLTDFRWKLVLAAAVTELLLLVLAGQTIGWTNVLNYPAILQKAEVSSEYAGVYPEHMVSIRGALSLFLPQTQALPISFMAMVVGFFAAACIMSGAKRNANAISLAVSLSIIICLVTSPHTMLYDCLFVAIPAVLTLPEFCYQHTPNTFFQHLWCRTLLTLPMLSCGLFVFWEFVPGCKNQPLPVFVFNLLLLVVGLVYFRTLSRGNEAITNNP